MFQASYEVFIVFLRLGLTSFGGPIAHLGYFQNEFVQRRRWLKSQDFSELVALCQALPGPASSQVAMAIGLQRAGVIGAGLAWLGFTLPSAVLLTLLALGLSKFNVDPNSPWIHGLKLAAVAVVAQALWSMGRQSVTNILRAALAIAVAICAYFVVGAWAQVALIAVSAVAGMLLLEAKPASKGKTPKQSANLVASIALLSFAILLALGPWLNATLGGFYRAGALVFGGGHVVLPLLRGLNGVSDAAFLAGYGAAQAMPGPLFSIAAYLGAAGNPLPQSWLGALAATIAIFLPGFLLVLGVLPYWNNWRKHAQFRQALEGASVGVIGLLAVALYTPVGTSAFHGPLDLGLTALGFYALEWKRWPSWAVVLGCLASALLFRS